MKYLKYTLYILVGILGIIFLVPPMKAPEKEFKNTLDVS